MFQSAFYLLHYSTAVQVSERKQTRSVKANILNSNLSQFSLHYSCQLKKKKEIAQELEREFR